MDIFYPIKQPTLLLDETRCRANIARMAEKAARSGVRFRPHFKTHQSAIIGDWFRPHGVTAITVSSVRMVQQFAARGWQDITIAFPVNLRQMDEINALASSIQLGLLAESAESIESLTAQLTAPVDLWLKADVGAQRTGIPVDDHEAFIRLARLAAGSPKLKIRGVLTHAGHTYHAAGPQDVMDIYHSCVERMHNLRSALRNAGFPQMEISWGDTPSCSLVDDLSAVDEIRPGNFVLYDATQLGIGSCREGDIAVAVACPVVALHPERGIAVFYGGAIHLFKEAMAVDGKTAYGLVAFPEHNSWGKILPGAYVQSLSQEHGLAHLPPDALARVHVGDLLVVIPAHSCLVVNLFNEYLTLDGTPIPILH